MAELSKEISSTDKFFKFSKMIKYKSFIFISIILLGIMLMVFFTLNRNPERLWFDEQWYLNNVEILKQYGLSNQFLINYKGPAGPLYAIIHYLLEPATNLMLPYIRLVNITLALITAFFLYRTNIILRCEKPLICTLSFFAIPMTYVCSGMALTEIPAMLFVVMSILFLIHALEGKKPFRSCIYAIFGGIFLSLAILGRQPYLLVCIAVLIYFLPIKNTPYKLLPLILFLIFSLALPTYVFYIWENIQPPIESRTGNGFNLFHGLLSFAYAFIVMIILAPKWINSLNYKYVLYLFGAILIINLLFLKIDFLPMMSFSEKHFNTFFIKILSSLFGTIVIFFSFLFLHSCYSYITKNIDNQHDLFIAFACILILSTSAKVTHQFSSRYVAQAIPFLILMSRSYVEVNSIKIFTTLLGIVIGLLSLNSFFY